MQEKTSNPHYRKQIDHPRVTYPDEKHRVELLARFRAGVGLQAAGAVDLRLALIVKWKKC
jgi:hypothetical protein